MIERDQRSTGALVVVVKNEFGTTVASGEVQPPGGDQGALIDWRQNPDIHAFSSRDGRDMRDAWGDVSANADHLDELYDDDDR